MNNMDMQNLVNQFYNFVGIPKKSQQHILNILSYCKEIRDTAYPMKDSLVTELEIVEFTARKEKDLYYINGLLSLIDGERQENRSFEAYIIEEKEESKTRVYLDITRLSVTDEPKMIRTSEDLVESNKTISSVTIYASIDASEEKTFSSKFPKNSTNEFIFTQKNQQLSAL